VTEPVFLSRKFYDHTLTILRTTIPVLSYALVISSSEHVRSRPPAPGTSGRSSSTHPSRQARRGSANFRRPKRPIRLASRILAHEPLQERLVSRCLVVATSRP